MRQNTLITFTPRKSVCPPVFLSQTPNPTCNIVCYLGLYMDKRLTWNPHTRLKRQETNRCYKMLLQLLDNISKVIMTNKLLMYNTVIKPTWTRIMGFNQTIEALQSKMHHPSNAPFYVSNLTLHSDLKVPFVSDLASSLYQKFHSTLHLHPNPLVQSLSPLTLPLNPPRRQRRRWARDLK